MRYAGLLEKELGLGVSVYFHCYKWGLAVFGERFCDRLIITIKKTLGHTPDL
jgi:hypothetical protein